MLPMPTLPTDNLYKFLAVFGVALVLSSGALSYLNDEALFAHAHEYAVWSASVEASDSAMVRAAEDPALTARRLAAIRDTVIAHDAVLRRFVDEGQSAQRIHDDKARYLMFMRYAGWFAMLGGFVGWYWRVQRHLDRSLKA